MVSPPDARTIMSCPTVRFCGWQVVRAIGTNKRMSSHDKGDKRDQPIFPPIRQSTQPEAVSQRLKCILRYLLRFLAKLAVEIRVVERIDAALERLGVGGAIKEPRRDTQRADPVTGSPGGTDFIGLANHAVSPARRIRELGSASSRAWSEPPWLVFHPAGTQGTPTGHFRAVRIRIPGLSAFVCISAAEAGNRRGGSWWSRNVTRWL